MISGVKGRLGGGLERRDVRCGRTRKMEREERRSRGSGEGARQKQLQNSIWILLAAVGKI